MNLVTVENEVAMTCSKTVADTFGKRHDNVIRDIKELIAKAPEFGALNFEESTYISKQNKKLPSYKMTKDGFTLLAMGYTTEKAIQFKIAYINQFNEMDRVIRDGVTLSVEIDRACLAYEDDKQTASYCGKGLSKWKKKRDDHLVKIASLQERHQMLLELH